MKTLLNKTLRNSSALVIALSLPLVSLPAFAQEAQTGQVIAPAAPLAAADSPYYAGIENGLRASSFIGKRIYVTEQDTTGMAATAIAAADAQWEDAGEISDLIISLNADTEAVLVDFGGFLGIGEKTVALSLDDIVMVPDSNSPDDYFIVFHGSKAELEAAPAFDPNMVFAAETAAPVAADGTAAPASVPASDVTATSGDVVDYAVMTEADLVGKRVIGPNDQDVGEISAITLNAENKIEAAVIDVGGFLGIGEKPVALSADMLRLVRAEDGSGDYFRVSLTQEQLEALPTHSR